MILDRLFDLLPLMFGILGGGVVALQMVAHTRQRLRRARKLHEGQQVRVGTASRGMRERASGTLALR
uniref:hypothetical protein n=1 Tax=Niveispirillum sp. TaxID=1917217 RepID=UPI001B64D4F8